MSASAKITNITRLLVAISAREHTLLVGPPGFGKTKAAHGVLRAVFGQGNYGVLEFSPNTPPEVVSGALDIAHYMQTGDVRIKTDGTPRDPSIRAWLWDELSRANEAALDAALPALDPPTGRHMVTVATANWWPKGKRFEALASRFGLWLTWEANRSASQLLRAFAIHARSTGHIDPVSAMVEKHVVQHAAAVRDVFDHGVTEAVATAAVKAFYPILEAFVRDVVNGDDEKVIATMGLTGDAGDAGDAVVQALLLVRERMSPRLMRQWAGLATKGAALLAALDGGDVGAAAKTVWSEIIPFTLPAPDARLRAMVEDLVRLPLGGGRRVKVQALLLPFWQQLVDALNGGNVLQRSADIIAALERIQTDAQAAGLSGSDEFKEEYTAARNAIAEALRGSDGVMALVPDWAQEAMGLLEEEGDGGAN